MMKGSSKMNELFEFHRKLNFKKIAIIIIFALFTIIVIFDILSFIFKSDDEKLDDTKNSNNPNTIFYDSNNTISLELSKQYNLSQYESSNNYLIELRSENNLNIFVSHQDLVQNKTLSEVVSADHRTYVNEFTSYSNLSEVKDISTNDKQACTYSFHYLDSKTNTAYYLQIVWIETENGYYILDIEFPLENLNNYTHIINDVLDTFNTL